MPVGIKIFNRAGPQPVLYAARDVGQLPVSFGRDAACTIVLDDPHKHISRFHVEIEEQDGAYWMAVVSKVNPVIVKGRSVGPGTRLLLESGESFEIGEYEIHVTLPQVASKPRASIPEPTLVPVARPAQNVPSSPLLQVLSAPAASEAAPPPEATFVPNAAIARAKSAAGAADGADLMRAFLEGAGLPHKDVPGPEMERMLRDCGGILRAAVEGLMTLLVARAEMRREFQAEDRTMVAPRDNNPLKLMSDPNEAMAFLFDPAERTDGFLDPVQAVGDACEDLRSHELAVVAGMRAAIIGVLRRLNPHALEVAFEKSTTAGLPLPGRKGRLWDLFVAHHERLAHEAQEDFYKVFGRDFMNAYETHLRRTKGGRCRYCIK